MQAHLHTAQGSRQREVVEVPEVTDPEHSPGELAQPGAQRHVVTAQGDLTYGVRVVRVRHEDCGQRAGVLALVRAEHLQAPPPDGCAGGLGVPLVPCEDVRQSLLAQHLQRDPQAVQQVGRGGVREEPLGVRLQDRRPVPVRLGEARAARSSQRLLTDGVEAEPGWEHQTFLRARDGHVDSPLVVAVVDRGERGDRVDQQQRRVVGRVDGGADLRDAAGDTGRGLVVHHAHGLDPMPLVVGETLLDRFRVDTVSPIARHEVHVEPESAGHRLPQCGEVPGLEGQHPVTGGEGVDQRGLPRTGPRARVDHDVSVNGEHRLERIEQLGGQPGELGTTMVDRRSRHRMQHAVGHVRRAWDLEKMAPGPRAHAAVPLSQDFRHVESFYLSSRDKSRVWALDESTRGLLTCVIATTFRIAELSAVGGFAPCL